MPNDFLLESPEEKAAIEAIKIEAPQPEPQPQPEPKVEPTVEAKVEPEIVKDEPKVEPVKTEPKKPVRLVPHEALHEERVKRQALERRIAEMEKGKTEPKSEVPDENEDPLGTIAHLKKRLADFDAERQQNDAMADLGRRTQARVSAYAQEHPEYADQMNFVRASRANELRLLGADDANIARQIQAEEMALARVAIDNDRDPGEMIASLAKVRGWQPKAEAKAEEPTKEEPKKVDTKAADEKIDRLERGRKASTSPSNAGGGAASSEMTIEDLLSLDGAAFDKASAAFISAGRRIGA